MKKIVCVLVAVITLFTTGCVLSGGKNPQADQLLKQRDKYTKETKVTIDLPEKYKNYTRLYAIDDQYYYMEDVKPHKTWNFIRVKRSNLKEIKKLASISNQNDIGISFGRNGKLYVNVLKWGADQHECQYQLIALTANGKKETVLSGKNSGLPGTTVFGDYIAISTADKSKFRNVKLFNLDTGVQKTVFQSKWHMKQNWKITGTIITGLNWPRRAPSNEGFCFTVSKMKNQTINDPRKGSHAVYFYSLKDKKSYRLANNQHPADYAGGSDQAFIATDYANFGSEGENKLYVRRGKDFDKYNIDGQEERSTVTGSGFLDNKRFLVYTTNGYFIFNLNNKSYDKKTFSGTPDSLTKEELSKLDYKGEIMGMEYYNKSFYLGTIERKKLVIYEIR